MHEALLVEVPCESIGCAADDPSTSTERRNGDGLGSLAQDAPHLLRDRGRMIGNVLAILVITIIVLMVVKPGASW